MSAWDEMRARSANPSGLLVGAYLAAQQPWPLGIGALDDALCGGLVPGLTVVGGESSCGKSALACQVAATAAESRRRVLYVSQEMSWEVCSMRMAVSAAARRGVADVQWGQLADRRKRLYGTQDPQALLEYDHVRDDLAYAVEWWEQGPMRSVAVVESVESVEEVCAMAEAAAVGEERPPLVVVDYVQLLDPGDGCESEYERVTATTQALQRLAMRLDTHVLAISSLRNGCAGEPEMGWYRGSGYLGYSAECALMLTRDREEPEDARGRRRVTCHVLKNKSGRSGEAVGLWFDGRRNYFEEA